MVMQHWPLREVLLTYLALVREQMQETYRHAQVLYQIRNAWGGGKEKPPEVPPLLNEASEQ